MRSSEQALQNRGFFTKEEVIPLLDLPVKELLNILEDSESDAVTRSCSVAALRDKPFGKDKEYWERLLKALTKEKALYTRIEICKNLEQGDEEAVVLMCNYLGKIGDNQHKKIPLTVSQKKSYPLPRDIIARTLGRMHPRVFKQLQAQFTQVDKTQLSELIDAMGYFLYFNPYLATEENFRLIENCHYLYSDDELITWRLVQCCSSFPIARAQLFLDKIKNQTSHPTIIMEIARSESFIDTSQIA